MWWSGKRGGQGRVGSGNGVGRPPYSSVSSRELGTASRVENLAVKLPCCSDARWCPHRLGTGTEHPLIGSRRLRGRV